jgi:hypothetical protein
LPRPVTFTASPGRTRFMLCADAGECTEIDTETNVPVVDESVVAQELLSPGNDGLSGLTASPTTLLISALVSSLQASTLLVPVKLGAGAGDETADDADPLLDVGWVAGAAPPEVADAEQPATDSSRPEGGKSQVAVHGAPLLAGPSSRWPVFSLARLLAGPSSGGP